MKKTIILASIFFILSSCWENKNEVTIEDNSKNTEIEEVVIVEEIIEKESITETWAVKTEENVEIITEEKEVLKEIVKDKVDETIIDNEIEIITNELIDDLSEDFDKELDQEILNLFK